MMYPLFPVSNCKRRHEKNVSELKVLQALDDFLVVSDDHARC